MVFVITINTAGDVVKAVNTLNRIKRRMPAMVRLGLRRWGKILQRDMNESARAAGIQDNTGELLGGGIQWRQGVQSDWGALFIRIHGVYLDSMPPHFVSITRRRTRLLAWARVAQSDSIRTRAELVAAGKIRSTSIYVRPHPFIATGYRRARPKLRPVLKRLAIRGIHTG